MHGGIQTKESRGVLAKTSEIERHMMHSGQRIIFVFLALLCMFVALASSLSLIVLSLQKVNKKWAI